MSEPQDNRDVHLKKQQAFSLLREGKLEEAKELYAQTCTLDPADAEAHYNLGTVAKELGRYAEAEAAYREAIRLKPDSFVVLHNLGTVLSEQDRLQEAAQCFEAALRLNPNALSHCNLGNVLTSQQQLPEAVAHYRQALALEPGHAEIYNNLGTALLRLGLYADAESVLREALRLKPDYVSAHVNLGGVLVQVGRLKEAHAYCRRAVELDRGCARALAGLAEVLERQGDVGQASALLEPLLQGDATDADVALRFTSLCRPMGRCTEAIELGERLLAAERPAVDVYRRTLLHFALGRLLDADNQFERAFAHYRLGNSLADQRFDPQGYVALIDALIDAYSAPFMGQAPRATIPSQRPVFIVGMPRSGTTLVEQILASHPAVYGAGELAEMQRISDTLPGTVGTESRYPRCVDGLTVVHCDQLAHRYLQYLATLAPQNAVRVTDKMPGNFHHLGLIALLFPQARVIHCRRDPLDTCLSCYFQRFGESHPYAYDLEHLGFYYRQYQRLMEHWGNVLNLPMMEVRYEELVADQEGMSRRLIEFCGLEWDERCLRFHETPRIVTTASYQQVRQPLYKGSVERWRHYAQYLEPLQRALGIGRA